MILSAHGNVRDAALALGVSDYLRKPLRIESLLEVAERYCRAIFLNYLLLRNPGGFRRLSEADGGDEVPLVSAGRGKTVGVADLELRF